MKKQLRQVPEGNKGLSKLPDDVRNKMGFMNGGGSTKKKELTKRQKETMKKHSEHHTKKHMDAMTKLMLAGKTFSEAHKITQKKVGS